MSSHSPPRLSTKLCRLFAVCLGVALTLCFFQIRRGVAQITQPDWTIVLRALQARRDAVGSIKAEYLFEYSVSPELEQEYNQSSSEAFQRAKANGNVSADSTKPHEEYDRVATCRYQRQDDLWREDITEAYPGGPEAGLLHHFQGFDGEKYFAYDAARSRGGIEPTAADIRGVTTRFGNVTNGAKFLGLWSPVDLFERLQQKGVLFRPAGYEQANGEQCMKYVWTLKSPNGKDSRFTAWVNPQKNYFVIKWKSEIFGKVPGSQAWNASVIIGNTSALEKTVDGAYVNKVFQQDYFVAKQDGKLHWQDSRRFTLHSAQLNEKIPRTVFAVQFPPGARVVDSILAPGRILAVGAEVGMAAEKRHNGIKVKPEVLDENIAPQPQPGEEFPKLSTP